MQWDEPSWNRHLRELRSALIKRDALLPAERRRDRSDRGRAERREYRAWMAKAKAHLGRLSALAPVAPEPRPARRMVARLRRWLDNPSA